MDSTVKTVDMQLNEFVDKILLKIDLNGLDEDVKVQMRKDLMDRVEDRINAALVANMLPEKIEEFEKILDSDNKEAIINFCQENIPNIQEVIAKELVDFEESYGRN